MKPNKSLLTTLFTFSLLIFPLFFSAQHKTIKATNGNPLTEIVDANSMKQGDWIFYDNNDVIIRKEVYKDHELQSRVISIQGKEIDGFNYQIEESIKSLISNNSNFNDVLFFGEAVVGENGEILIISFYNKIDSKTENLLKKEIRSIIEDKYKGRKNLILTF